MNRKHWPVGCPIFRIKNNACILNRFFSPGDIVVGTGMHRPHNSPVKMMLGAVSAHDGTERDVWYKHEVTPLNRLATQMLATIESVSWL